MSRTRLVVLYSLFAVIATVVNLGSQMLFIVVWPWLGVIELSIIIGTGTGLVCKYWLDKTYIFAYHTKSLSDHAKPFLLYTVMGIATTIIFWGTEYAFHWLFNSDTMRYLGAILGLSIGYVVKYQLDKRFVFIHQERP